MPLYEYQCFLCEYRFERLQKVMADPIKVCPACGGAVRRLLGVPALQFKGSGWYVTDYGKGSGPRPPEKNGTDSKGEAGKKSVASADKSADTGADSSKKSSSGSNSSASKADRSDRS